MSAYYDASYSTPLTLQSSAADVTLGPGASIEALGPAGTYALPPGAPMPLYGAVFGPGGSAFSITNLGLIEAVSPTNAPAGFGIVLGGAGEVVNEGTIAGGIFLAGAGTIINTGGITGASAGVVLAGGGTLVNAGSIGGGAEAVSFGGGAALLVIEEGAVFSSGVTAGLHGAATLELGSASAGSFDMGGSVNGFGAITFDSGQDWCLEGSVTELGGNFTEISGFSAGDTIILDGFKASSAVFDTAAGALDLRNIGGTITQLALAGPYAAGQFHITPLLQGSTMITLCFARGTRILTPAGERPVEALAPGDAVVTWHSGLARLKWIGRQSFAGPALACHRERLPVCLRPGALGADMPRRALYLSPGHAVLLDGILVLARDLINGITIFQDEAVRAVEYFALELERHDCVLAEGVFAESFADAPGLRCQFHNAASFQAQFPDHAPPLALSLCAPRPLAGPALEAVLAPVAARAAALIEPGRVRGFIDLMTADGHVEGWAQDCAHPELAVPLEIRAGGAQLGTCLACHHREDLRLAGIGRGHAKFSFDAPANLPVTVHGGADGAALPLTEMCRLRQAG